MAKSVISRGVRRNTGIIKKWHGKKKWVAPHKSFMLGICVKFYLNPNIIENGRILRKITIGKGGGFVIGTPRKIKIWHYYLLKSFMLEVSEKFYWNKVVIENFRPLGMGEKVLIQDGGGERCYTLSPLSIMG